MGKSWVRVIKCHGYQIAMKVKVRSEDRMVFEVDPITLGAKTVSYYDAYCYTYPEPDTIYLEYYDWTRRRSTVIYSQTGDKWESLVLH